MTTTEKRSELIAACEQAQAAMEAAAERLRAAVSPAERLLAAEALRRAERSIALAIRSGQAEGVIRSAGGDKRSRASKIFVTDDGTIFEKLSPYVFAPFRVLCQNEGGAYRLADGISEEAFEEAISAGRKAGNLSRAGITRLLPQQNGARGWIPARGANRSADAVQRRNLIRAWAEQGYSSHQMSERLGMRYTEIRRIAREMQIEIAADTVLYKTRLMNADRIVEETVNALEGLTLGIQLVAADELDPAQISDWAASLTASIRDLDRFIQTMKEYAQ